MSESVRKIWLGICAAMGSHEILRSALQFQQATLLEVPRKAMKLSPWLALRTACQTTKTTHALLSLLLKHERCYFELASNNKGRPKANLEQGALEYASWRVSGLTIGEFAVQSRKYQNNPEQRLHEVAEQAMLANPHTSLKGHSNETASHLLRRAHERNASRVLFAMLGKSQPASKKNITAMKQRLMRSQRLVEKDRAFARLVADNIQLLQWLEG